MVEMRSSIEAVMSLATQGLIADVTTGKIKDGFGISRALQQLEVNLKKEMIARVRTATLPEEGEGDDGWGD